MRQYYLLGVFLFFILFMVGCGFLNKEVRQNPDGTTSETYQGEKYLLAAREVSDEIAKSGFPFASLIGGGVSGLLGIATGVLGKIAANRNNAARASILAIESFTKDFDKFKESALMISKLTGNPEITAKIEEELNRIKPIKEVAEEISHIMNKEKVLDNMVQKTVSSFPNA